MFELFRKNKKAPLNPQPEDMQKEDRAEGMLSESLDKNIALMNKLFEDDDIMMHRRFGTKKRSGLDFCVFYSDGLVNSMMINEHIIEPLTKGDFSHTKEIYEEVKDCVAEVNEIKESADIQQIISSVTYGDTLLLVEGSSKVLIIGSKGFAQRSVSEPEGEKILSGPRDGFTEGLMVNLSLIRRRLRTNELKMRMLTIGKQTNTAVCVCYMDNIVNKKILKELYRRINKINMDSVLDSNYITEHIEEKSFLGFSTTGSTERPDVAVAKLLEGRIAIVVDGSPVVLTAPYLFIENFQSSEDYYVHRYYATFSRILRMAGFFLSIITPAVYIAVVAYHHEILPAALMMSISSERKNVPMGSSVEAFVMLLVFDVLKETGIRMPSHVGQALSIVGALVIGQAAVEARLVASPMIIVVAFTGITNLLVPKLGAALLVTRYAILMLASLFGLTGVICGVAVIVIHILNMQSYGVSATAQGSSLKYQNVKDTFFRAPWPKMLTRISPLTSNKTRARTK